MEQTDEQFMEEIRQYENRTTAIQWLKDLIEWDCKNFKVIKIEYLHELLDRAKEIEKEQIMKAVYDGMGTNFDPNMGRAEQYYNETYNK